tara:strand:- start:1460 stop:1606 length:147 start_codon:yes stop_codon:yes gene_type:complete
MKTQLHKFAILNWKRKRKGKLHISFIIDFFFGYNYCAECWIDWRLKNA